MNRTPVPSRSEVAILQDELTKLKADVARLRRALELIRQIAAATDGGPVIMEGRRGMIGDLAARALEETK